MPKSQEFIDSSDSEESKTLKKTDSASDEETATTTKTTSKTKKSNVNNSTRRDNVSVRMFILLTCVSVIYLRLATSQTCQAKS
jgi:hypothetical protein